MKILLISTFDLQAGAGRAAFRLMEGLNKLPAIEVKMLVLNSLSDHPQVLTYNNPLIKLGNKLNLFEKPDRLIGKYYRHKRIIPFSGSYTGLNKVKQTVKEFAPDLINLHWVQGGFLRPELLSTFKCPIVWTLHDMWTFTGGCHYDAECGKYISNCGSCPILDSGKEKDLSRRIYKRKSKVFQKLENLTINSPSSWLANCARESSLLQGHKVVNIHNGINLEVFKPIPKQVARALLNLPQNKKLILFGAMSALSDTRKGYHHLRDAIEHLSNREQDQYAAVIFGASKFYKDPALPIDQFCTGRLYDDASLVALYNAADVMVVPSEQENLANTIVESLACGTPVVAFDIGGNADMIDHQQNGYLAIPFKSEDLAEGIQWAIEENGQNNHLGIAARKKATDCFELISISKQHQSLFKACIEKYSPKRSPATIR